MKGNKCNENSLPNLFLPGHHATCCAPLSPEYTLPGPILTAPQACKFRRKNALYPLSLTIFGFAIISWCPLENSWDVRHFVVSGKILSCPKVYKRSPNDRIILKFLPEASYCLVQCLRNNPIRKTSPGIQRVEKVLVELRCNFPRLQIVGLP